MKFEEYVGYDAMGLAALVRSGGVTPKELLEVALGAIASRDGDINAVVELMTDQANAAIDNGLPQGPFTGVPFLLKNLNLAYAGVTTSNGCRVFSDFVPTEDATLVTRYKQAGLVALGKTNTPELGLAATTEPDLHGPTRNPWNREHSPGGSSGGAAAAVASGYLPMAHATDGGGSIRIPASMCGLFGLKPSRGRTPLGPTLGEGLGGMGTAHCVARSVRDSATLLDATHGAAPGDPYYAPAVSRPFADEVGAPVGQLKIALCTTDFTGTPVHPDCARAAVAAAELCESLGHIVEEACPNFDGLDLLRAWRIIPAANIWNAVTGRARAMGREPQPGDVEPVTWEWLQEGRNFSAGEYMEAINVMHIIGRRLGLFLQDYDFVLSPTLGRPSIRLGEIDMSTQDVGAFVQLVFGEISPLTPLFNQTGGAAMSVPLNWNEEGLPVGVQFGGGIGDEAKLIRLAAQLEDAAPWWDRHAIFS
jgi:amidase